MWTKEGQKAASTNAHLRYPRSSNGLGVTHSQVRIAENDLPCGVCRGTGKTKYQPKREQKEYLERVCESCYGSGMENCSPELRGKMYSELAQYIAPKRKAVEVNTQIQVSM